MAKTIDVLRKHRKAIRKSKKKRMPVEPVGLYPQQDPNKQLPDETAELYHQQSQNKQLPDETAKLYPRNVEGKEVVGKENPKHDYKLPVAMVATIANPDHQVEAVFRTKGKGQGSRAARSENANTYVMEPGPNPYVYCRAVLLKGFVLSRSPRSGQEDAHSSSCSTSFRTKWV